MNKETILSSFFVLLLASCSGSGLPEADSLDSSFLCISEASLRGVSPVSRATGYTAITQGSIGVFLADVSETNDNYLPVINRAYDYSDKGWAGNPSIMLGESAASVCAYYPYVDGYAESTKIPLKSRVYDAAHDLAYATAQSVDGTSNFKVSFKMSRAYALLTLNIARASNATGEITISNIALGGADNTGLNKENTLNISSGKYGTATAADAPDNVLNFPFPKEKEIKLGPGDNSEQKFLLVPAAALTNGLRITLTVYNETTTVSTVISEITKFEAGYQSTVSLKLDGTVLNIESVTIEEWVDHQIDGGVVLPVD